MMCEHHTQVSLCQRNWLLIARGAAQPYETRDASGKERRPSKWVGKTEISVAVRCVRNDFARQIQICMEFAIRRGLSLEDQAEELSRRTRFGKTVRPYGAHQRSACALNVQQSLAGR